MRATASACGSARATRRFSRLAGGAAGLVLGTGLLTSCAMGAFQRGERAARAGDWPAAVVSYEQAHQDDPSHVEVRIALDRARRRAALDHLDAGRALEMRDDLVAALAEYRQALSYAPAVGAARDRITQVERAIQDRTRGATSAVVVEPSSPLTAPPARDLISLHFRDASLQQVLEFLGEAAGVRVIYDEQFQDRPYSVDLDGVTFTEALKVILTETQHFYRVLNSGAIRVSRDSSVGAR